MSCLDREFRTIPLTNLAKPQQDNFTPNTFVVLFLHGPLGILCQYHRNTQCFTRHWCIFKVFWSSENRSFVFNQIFVYGTLMGVDYKSEKKI